MTCRVSFGSSPLEASITYVLRSGCCPSAQSGLCDGCLIWMEAGVRGDGGTVSGGASRSRCCIENLHLSWCHCAIALLHQNHIEGKVSAAMWPVVGAEEKPLCIIRDARVTLSED